MSDASPVRTGIVALFCVFIATTQVLLLAQVGDRAPVGATENTGLETHGREVRALLREIRDRLRAGGPSPEIGRTGQAEEPAPATRMDASEVPFDAALITRLEQALLGFGADVGRLAEVGSHASGLRQRYESGAGRTSRKMSEQYSSDEEAEKDLLFRSYSNVLDRFGPPNSIGVADSGEVYWHYGPGHVRFFEGFVTGADQ